MRDEPATTVDPERAWGGRVFAGTRVPVEVLFEYLEAGKTIDEFLRQFPTVTRQQAAAVLESVERRSMTASGETLTGEPMPDWVGIVRRQRASH